MPAAHRNRLVRQVHARPRLLIAIGVALAVWVFLPAGLFVHAVTRWLLAWNAGTVLYVVLAAIMMSRSTHEKMQGRAQSQDEGALTILVLVAVAAAASLAAIAGELTVVRDMHGPARAAHVALAGLTVLSSWAFIQVMFALHYAHDYYSALVQGRPAGLVGHVLDVRHPHDPGRVDGHVGEHPVQVHVLLGVGVDQVVEVVAGDRQDRLAVALGVIEAIE